MQKLVVSKTPIYWVKRRLNGRNAHVAFEASTVIAVADVDELQRIDFLGTSSARGGSLCLRQRRGLRNIAARPVTEGSEDVVAAQTARAGRRWRRVERILRLVVVIILVLIAVLVSVSTTWLLLLLLLLSAACTTCLRRHLKTHTAHQHSSPHLNLHVFYSGSF